MADVHRRGWCDGTGGNFSCLMSREPLQLLMAPSGVHKGNVSADELIVVDGPTSESSEIDQCASAVDSAIIVRDMMRTDTLAIEEFSCRLRESGIQGVGVVENFT